LRRRRPFRGLPRSFWGLWVGTLIAWSGRMILPFLVLFFTREAHYSVAAAGAFLSLYGVGGVVSVVAAGPLIDHVGSKRLIVWSLGLCGGVSALMALVFNTVIILAMLPLLGAFTQVINPAVNAFVAVGVPSSGRRQAFSVIYVARNAGFSLGPAVGGLLVQQSYRLVFVGQAFAMVVAAMTCAATLPKESPAFRRSESAAPDRGGVSTALRDVTFMLFFAFSFLVTIVYSQNLNVTLPLVMSKGGYAPGQYGLLLTINGALLVILLVPADHFLRRVRITGLLVLGAGLLGCGIVAQAWATSWWLYAGCVVVWTSGELLNSPITATAASQLAPPHLIGRYMGIFTAAMPIAAVMSPLVGGLMIQNFGTRSVIFLSGGVLFLAMIGRIATARGTEARMQTGPASAVAAVRAVEGT
jgi:MFS family permease